MSKASFDLTRIVDGLRDARARWRESQQRGKEVGGRDLPSREALAAIVDGLRGALFPMRLGPPDLRQENEDFYVGHTLDSVLGSLLAQVRLEIRHPARLQPDGADPEAAALAIVREFGAALPRLRMLLDSDVLAAFHGDPAARSVDEVLLCYPGVTAMIHHRLAHELYELGVPLLARIMAELAHCADRHRHPPGRDRSARSFFIDHGTGVVIGETARHRRARAALPGRHARRQALPRRRRRAACSRACARHPIVEDDVVIYAGATILGRITIGRGSIIGGNVWLTRSVPPGSHIAQAQRTRRLVVEGGAGVTSAHARR